jgi:fibronectin-binding autotransporter adhesin
MDTGDTIAIAGNSSGTTLITTTNLTPAVATGNDITVITVGGTSAPGDFALAGGSLTAGAFDYDLEQQGSNFVLASALNSTGATYLAAPAVLNGFNRLPTLEQRVGERQWAAGEHGRTGSWLRIHGDRMDANMSSGDSFSSNKYGLQAGIDLALEPGTEGQFVVGLTAQYGTLSSSIRNALGSGTIAAEGLGFGVTATWYGNQGTYVDGQAQMNWLETDIASSAAGNLASGELVKTAAVSLEVGHRFELSDNRALVPQAQLTWGLVDGGSFTDTAGNSVDLGRNESLIGRLGLAYEFADTTSGGDQRKGYVIGNILHDFSSDHSVTVAGAPLSASTDQTWGEIGVGGSYQFNDGKSSVYGEAAYRAPLGGSGGSSKGLHVTAGFRMEF